MTTNCTPPIGATAAQKRRHANQWHPAPADEATAKANCDGCPALASCLKVALDFVRDNNEPLHGIWGGTTETERYALLGGRPQRRKPAAQTEAVA